MRRYIVDGLLVLVAFGSVALAATFTDIASPQYYGKASQEKAYAAIDANFALIEVGDVPMTNGETIDNSTDGEVRITADDDAALLLELALESDNAVASVADDDYMQISMTAYDSATNKQEYASIDLIATDVTTATEDSRIDLNFMAGGAAKEVQIGASSAGAMAMTLPAGMEASIDGKYAVVGGDATTALMIQKASITSTGAPDTVTFPVVFGEAPVVTVSYTEDPGDVRPIYVTSITATGCVVYATSDKNFAYIAVGTRP